MTREELLTKWGTPTQVGSDGFVQLLDFMGNDSTIVQIARNSYGKGTKQVSTDTGLLRYLMRNAHTSPFEMAEFIFNIRLPIYIMRQLVRHRTASLNERSLRYSEYSEGDFERITEWRAPHATNKQGSTSADLPHSDLSDLYNESCNLAEKTYSKLIEQGVAREQARCVLPVSSYTEVIFKIDLKNLLHLIRLRSDSHAQKEIQEFSNAMGAIVADCFPVTWQAFKDYQMDAISLSGPVAKELLPVLSEVLADPAIHDKLRAAGLSVNEINELKGRINVGTK
jgi:thymidylate synthase (FAD)